jgi:glycosyltransferase involved in cell wall biosynthesis
VHSLKMRIAHICEDWEVGGIKSLVLDLCGSLRTSGTENAIFFLYGEDGLRGMNGSDPGVPIRMNQRFRINLSGLLRMRSALHRWSPDCIHCHSYYAAASALLLRAGGLYCPIVYTVHANIYRGRQKSDFLIGWVARASDRVVAVSYEAAASMERFTRGIVCPRVVLNGLDLARLKLPPDFTIEAKRQALGVPGCATIIVSVAGLNLEKDHLTLLRAFAESLPHLRDPRLLLVGDGRQRGQLETMVKALGVKNRVLFLGRRSDVYDILCASDIFVLSSYNEGLPISVLEACCAGLPVIATEVGGISDLRRSGLDVVLSQKQDADSLRRALVTLADPVQRRSQGWKLRDHAKQLFSIESTAASYLALYRELVKNRQRRAA